MEAKFLSEALNPISKQDVLQLQREIYERSSMVARLKVQHINRLEKLRAVHEKNTTREKTRILGEVRKCLPYSADLLFRYHHVLLFLLAYPSDPKIYQLALAELSRIAALAPEFGEELEDSGIAGSVSDITMGFTLTEWLSRRFPKDLSVDWETLEAGSGLQEFFNLIITPAERTGFADTQMPLENWVRVRRGSDKQSDLEWLLNEFREASIQRDVLENLLLAVNVRLKWTLDDPIASLTFNRFPKRRIFYHKKSKRFAFDANKLFNSPLPSTRTLNQRSGQELIDCASATLCVRHRETDPVTFANPQDIRLLQLERGIDIAHYSMLPEHRHTLESYVGYVAAKNQIPVTYGGAWIFFDRANIGVNIFEIFRGGESSYLFSQIIRSYRQLFKVNYFFVDQYQIGKDNDEAIQSGAFWFYYRLGFRPVEKRIADSAEREFQNIRNNRKHRTSQQLLRRFATSPLVLSLSAANSAQKPIPDAAALSLRVTRFIGEKFNGDKRKAQDWCQKKIKRSLGISARDISSWPASEQLGFERLTIPVGMIPDLSSWQSKEKQALLSVMRAKGGTHESSYVQKLRSHSRLREAFT